MKLANGEINFRSLIIEGVVEWVDAEEEEDSTSLHVRSFSPRPSPKATALAWPDVP